MKFIDSLTMENTLQIGEDKYKTGGWKRIVDPLIYCSERSSLAALMSLALQHAACGITWQVAG